MVNIMSEVDEATERYRHKLENGFFKEYRSRNFEKDYAENKEDRDTQAIFDFAESDDFQVLLNRC